MINNFKHKGLKLFFFLKGDLSGVNPKHERRLKLVLFKLHTAYLLQDLNFPGAGFHPLKGDKKDQFSISISGNWRIIFRFHEGAVYDVDYLDYH